MSTKFFLKNNTHTAGVSIPSPNANAGGAKVLPAAINPVVGHSNGKLGDTYGHISLQAKLDAVDAMRMI